MKYINLISSLLLLVFLAITIISKQNLENQLIQIKKEQEARTSYIITLHKENRYLTKENQILSKKLKQELKYRVINNELREK